MTSQFSTIIYSKTGRTPHALIIVYHIGISTPHKYSALVLNFTKSHNISVGSHNLRGEENLTSSHKKTKGIVKWEY